MAKHPLLWFFIGMASGYFAIPYVIGMFIK